MIKVDEVVRMNTLIESILQRRFNKQSNKFSVIDGNKLRIGNSPGFHSQNNKKVRCRKGE
ncbi:hypothetical protein NARC_150117 [Candidatus Nitrosocosmicus arcticus]|uniref:Uncharacterized protein n=1 Tax=Candidatus Nitrosocosmicus arcticus TaxID=2035267 RepID=A0A557SSD8_9ARCH|nr:hypothetical protein NARC_150117 [Candidatus Nitrosocosmicus arcticus]